MSTQTSAWIFIGAQHPSSRKAFVHYASDKLRDDAMEDSIKLTNHFADLTTKLNQISGANALAAQNKLRETEQRFLKFQEKHHRDLAAAEDMMKQKNKEAEYLKTLLAAAGVDINAV